MVSHLEVGGLRTVWVVWVLLSPGGCGQTRPAAPHTETRDDPSPSTPTAAPVEPTFATGLEIWLPDQETSFGIAIVARRRMPAASEVHPPPPVEGVDATGLCIGYDVRADPSGVGLGLGGDHARVGELALPRVGLPAPIDVVVARDGVVTELLTLAPCDDSACDAEPIVGDTALVLPAGTIARLGILVGSRMFADP